MNVITNKIFQVDAGRKIIAIGPRAESKYTQAVQMLDNPTFIRGDANGDGVVDISDPTTILNHLFEGQCSCTNGACDSNDDGNVDITDAIYLLTFLFSGGPPPPPPFPLAGKDPTPNP